MSEKHSESVQETLDPKDNAGILMSGKEEFADTDTSQLDTTHDDPSQGQPGTQDGSVKPTESDDSASGSDIGQAPLATDVSDESSSMPPPTPPTRLAPPSFRPRAPRANPTSGASKPTKPR